jgi:hypothetical protein
MEIEKDYHWHTKISRVLNRTEIQLLSYCNSEREAVALAKVITLPEHASYAQIEQAVIAALCNGYEAIQGNESVVVEYLCGQRRDLIRGQA